MRYLAALSFALALLLSGCTGDFVERRTTPVLGDVPQLDVPPRPTMDKLTPEELANYLTLKPDVRAKLESNDKKLKMYAEQLETAVVEYNGFVRYRKKANDQWLGIKPPEEKGK